jgi:hypothetical protein
MFAKNNQATLRDSIQQPVQALDENWESVKVEATQLVTELQAMYDDITHAFKEVVDRRHERQQKPVVRFIRHYPWLPLAMGIGAIAALVIATRAR